jgi:2'-5' RNA ligase
MNETQRQVKELLKKGLIRESTSPFAAPITLANKKDGTKRFCVDYHELNKNTIADKEPVPHIHDVIDRLSGAKYFSKLDVA